MRKSLANKRAKYYTLIYQYKARREIIRKKLGCCGPEYRKAIARINKKIKLWGRYIKKYDMIKNQIIALGNMVAYFTGHNVKSSGRCNTENMKLARMIFYKYGIENLKIEQKLLREYVGAKRIGQPAEYRKVFNLMLRVDTLDHKLQWENFKRYYKEWPVTGSDYIDNRKVVA